MAAGRRFSVILSFICLLVVGCGSSSDGDGGSEADGPGVEQSSQDV